MFFRNLQREVYKSAVSIDDNRKTVHFRYNIDCNV